MRKRSLKSAPKDGTKVDLHMHIYASPRSMGMEDNFWVPHCWWDGGKWVHMHRGKPAELYGDYITGWAPDGSRQTDYRETP